MPAVMGTTQGFVYFIQAEDGGPVKIGFATDIDRRLKALQAGSPVTLKVLAFFSAQPDHERALHAMFREHRAHGEWFEPVPELLAIIETHTPALDGDVFEVSDIIHNMPEHVIAADRRSIDRDAARKRQNELTRQRRLMQAVRSQPFGNDRRRR